MSNSELRTWKRCKRKWWLAFYRRLTLHETERTGARQLGTLVHHALSSYYSTSSINPWTTLEADIAADLEPVPEQAKEIEAQAELARLMVGGYLQWVQDEGLDEGLRILGDEMRIEAHLLTMEVAGNTYAVTFMGKLDVRLVREFDGARFFMDHKTVGNLTTPVRTLHMDEQMLSYLLLERLQPEGDGVYVAGGMYNMLRKVKRTLTAKPPFYDRVEVHHNVQTLRNFWTRVTAEAGEIVNVRVALDAGADHQVVAYPNPDSSCTWQCDYFPVCPMFDDGSNAEGLVESLYSVGDPYQRYDEETEA